MLTFELECHFEDNLKWHFTLFLHKLSRNFTSYFQATHLEQQVVHYVAFRIPT